MKKYFLPHKKLIPYLNGISKHDENNKTIHIISMEIYVTESLYFHFWLVGGLVGKCIPS